MKTIKQQRGASFTSWLVIIAVAGLLGILGLKAVPIYIEYHEVKSLVDSIATDSKMKNANRRMLNKKLEKFLNINAMDDHLSPKDFKLIRIKGKKDARKLAVEYEVRQPWIANLDFVAKFNYEKRMGSALD